MAGLGFGSLAGGHVADRLDDRRRLIVFGACEAAIGVFALASCWIYYDVLYVHFGAYNIPRGILPFIIFAVTLWPTFFMGMSLPLAAKVVTTDAADPGRWVPVLYGANTLGAACGSALTVALLFPHVSFRTGVFVGAGLSFGCGLAALVLVGTSRVHPTRPVAIPASASATPTSAHVFGWRTWLMLYALSGFTALSLEILWFRVLGVILKSNAYTFGHLLALFLTGLALGSFAGNSRLLRRWPAAASFLALQAAIPLSAALLLDAFALSVNRVPVLDPLWEYLAAYEPLVRLNLKSPLYLIVHGAIPVALILPPTMLMGASFASLQRAVQRDLAELGRRVGWLQTANITGSMAGALATGLLFLDVLGSAGTLRLLAIVSTLFIVLFARTISGPAMQFVGASLTAVAVLAVAATPTSRTFWARMHGTPAANVTVAEDASGLALLKPRRNNTQIVLHANGIGQSFLPFGGTHTALGTLAAFIHPNPEMIAIIGLGTGDTVFGSAGRAETQRVDSIEIIEPELTVLRGYSDRTRFPALDLVLSDPRIVHHFTDGRAFLRRSSNRYDIIEADALRPTSAYSGNLYSIEYFAQLRDRLRPGGYAVTWVPTPRVLDTFASVFPFVLVLQDVAIGSLTPIAYDRATVEARLASPFSARHFREGGIDIATVLAPFLRADPIRVGPESSHAALSDINHDLFPKDEFGIPPRTR